MAKGLKPLVFLSLLLLLPLNFISLSVQSRPLNPMRAIGFAPDLSLRPIKTSGSSPSGGGHSFNIADTLGGVEDSGPSPGGGGHRPTPMDFEGDLSLGPIRTSDPSSGGGGHSFTIADTLGGIKDSVPSPGGGHSSTIADPLGGNGIKDSGPSPGGGGHKPSPNDTNGGTVNSGP